MTIKMLVGHQKASFSWWKTTYSIVSSPVNLNRKFLFSHLRWLVFICDVEFIHYFHISSLFLAQHSENFIILKILPCGQHL